MNDLLPSTDRDRCYEDVEWDEEEEAYRCSQPVRCIERGDIRGVAVGDPKEQPTIRRVGSQRRGYDTSYIQNSGLPPTPDT